MYKMYLISAEGYENARVHFVRVQKTDEIWASMKNAQDGMGVKKMFVLILKEIHGICGPKKPSKEQIKKYKKTEREILQKV